ncbi:MAG: peptide deformylase [Verrucomicrobiales bacterium]|jgi:peptide deformylase
MIRTIVLYGDPVLRERGAKISEVTDEIRTLADDMIETMVDAEGVGLAAQQIGKALQIAVVDVSHAEEPATYIRVNGEDQQLLDLMPLIFMNPTIERDGKRIADQEGCLSFPEIRAPITRPGAIKAKLTRLDGEEIELETDGLLARAIQHETDHLNGILFIDRMSAAKKVSLRRTLKEMRKEGEAEARNRG